ncbi:MAG: hypothetical protein ACTSU6_01365 [Candidatus Njordarchaeales archaeon]
MKKVKIDGNWEIECSYPNDTGYGILGSHIVDDMPSGIRDFLIKYVK